MNKKSKLGRGLQSLIASSHIETSLQNPEHNFNKIHITSIDPNPDQPRKFFDPRLLEELSESISQKGILQPIVVYKNKDTERYVIISGERRYRAANMANIMHIPAIILENISEKEAFALAMIENLQRDDLNIIEEIEGYHHLIQKHNYTQEELSTVLSKSRSHVTNLLRLNKLPEIVKEKLTTGMISMGHARALLSVENPEKFLSLIISNSLNVRQTEKLLKKYSNNKSKNYRNKNQDNEDLKYIFEDISQNLGLTTRIFHKNNQGKVTLHFRDLKELDIIISKLT